METSKDSTNPEGIRKCPFCGSLRPQIVRSFIDSDSNIVHCPACDACGPPALSTRPAGTAEARWNAYVRSIETSAHNAGATKLAITMLERFRDGRIATAAGTHETLLGPRDQLLQEADWFDHAVKVLRSTLTDGQETGAQLTELPEAIICPESTDGHWWTHQGTAHGMCMRCKAPHPSNQRIAEEHGIKDWYRGVPKAEGSEP